MRKICKPLLAFALGIGAATPSALYATNGYMAIGYGLKAKGMGGAAVAFPQDSLVAATNPAGMARIGSRMDVFIEAFVPPRSVAGNGIFGLDTNGSVKSNDNFFPIPGFGINFEVSEDLSYGLSFVGNGANTHYQQNFFDLTGTTPPRPYGHLGVELIQMQILPTVSYKLSPTQAVGLSPVIGLQVFKAHGLGNFNDIQFEFVNADQVGKFTNNGHSWSYGAGVRLGWLGSFYDERLSLGAAYGSKVYMSRFKQYSGLFAEQGDFDIPENYAVGMAFKFTPKLTMAFDIQRINYSNVKSVGNRHPTTSLQDPCTRPIAFAGACLTPGATANPTSMKLGETDGFGFGWMDQTAYKLGFNFALNNKWTLRTGYNYGKSPVPDDQLLFNMLAPAITERHVTVGGSYEVKGIYELSMSYVRALKAAQTCEAPSCTTMLSQSPGEFVAARLDYHALGIQFAMKF